MKICADLVQVGQTWPSPKYANTKGDYNSHIFWSTYTWSWVFDCQNVLRFVGLYHQNTSMHKLHWKLKHYKYTTLKTSVQNETYIHTMGSLELGLKFTIFRTTGGVFIIRNCCPTSFWQWYFLLSMSVLIW